MKRWITRTINLTMLLALGLMSMFSAHADEMVTARVTLVEPSYMPGAVVFMIDKSLPSCPAGSWLNWNKGADNNRAVYASLLSAMITGKRITLYINSGDTTCAGKHLHVLKD